MPGPEDLAAGAARPSRRGPRRLRAAAVLAGSVLVVGLAAVPAGAAPDRVTCVPALALRGTARVPVDPAGVPQPGERAALGPVAALLAGRDRAVGGGVPAQGLTGTAAQVVARLRDVPVTAWSSRVVAVAEPSVPDGSAAAPGPGRGADVRVAVRVEVRYRLEGDVHDTVRDRLVVATASAGCWRLAADGPDRATGTVPDLWDLGPVRVERSGRVVAVASAGLDDGLVRQVAEDTEAAAAGVDAVWGTGWRRNTVLLLPGSLEDAAALSRGDATAMAQLAAVTYGPSSAHGQDGSAFGDQRVLFVPGALTSLTATGRRFVLAHELTHEATASGARYSVPIWLSECFADVVGFSAIGASAADVDRYVEADLRAAALDRLPASLPDVASFDPALGEVAAAYALSDAACLALGDGHRPGRLARVYRTAAGTVDPAAAGTPGPGAAAPWAAPVLAGLRRAVEGAAAGPGPGPGPGEPPPPGQDPNAADAAALRAALASVGTDEARLVAAWHRRVVDLVGPLPGSP
ncbi:hypothetical protein [Kineosporia sp. A_224]|uniref:hypothetical protein n=1 Tax=Kineosporia sp. A_224 TaxID=1962180 RepID=UPI000B4B5A04|nr:hypothetical protein [Kineosporia sp. A_224]